MKINNKNKNKIMINKKLDKIFTRMIKVIIILVKILPDQINYKN